MNMASESVDNLLSQLSLTHLIAACAGATIESWAALSRPALLTHLKDTVGVQQLQERQKIANGLSKYHRQCSLHLGTLSTSAKAPIAIRSTYGLCNQLRVLLSYRACATANDRPLVLHWQRTAACTARFCDLFEAVDGAVVVDEAADLELVRPGLSKLPTDVIPSVYLTHPAVFNTAHETAMWKVLQPLPALRDAVATKLAMLGPSFVAVHVRRTDHMTQGGQKQLAQQSGAWTADKNFERFLESHPTSSIYLATDNASTQRHFLSRFGDRIKALTPIGGAPRESANDEASVHRHTPVQDAVVDIFTCVAAEFFKGTYYSSFSDAIQRCRLARGCAHRDDEHSLVPPEWDPMQQQRQAGESNDRSVASDNSVVLDEPALVALLQLIEAHSGDLGKGHAAWLAGGWQPQQHDGSPSRWIPTGTANLTMRLPDG